MSQTSSLSSEERFERFIRLLPTIDDPALHVEPKDLDKKIDMFIFARFGGKVMVEFKSDLERRVGLMKELSMIGGYLHGYWASRKSNKE